MNKIEQDEESALRVILENNKASGSLLQMHLSWSWVYSHKILERLEEKGYIGKVIGCKPREILIRNINE